MSALLTNMSLAKSHRRLILMMRSCNSPEEYFMKNFAFKRKVLAITAGSTRTLTRNFSRCKVQLRINPNSKPLIAVPIKSEAIGSKSCFVPFGITLSNSILLANGPNIPIPAISNEIKSRFNRSFQWKAPAMKSSRSASLTERCGKAGKKQIASLLSSSLIRWRLTDTCLPVAST